jgi:hypothetical protein
MIRCRDSKVIVVQPVRTLSDDFGIRHQFALKPQTIPFRTEFRCDMQNECARVELHRYMLSRTVIANLAVKAKQNWRFCTYWIAISSLR